LVVEYCRSVGVPVAIAAALADQPVEAEAEWRTTPRVGTAVTTGAEVEAGVALSMAWDNAPGMATGSATNTVVDCDRPEWERMNAATSPFVASRSIAVVFPEATDRSSCAVGMTGRAGITDVPGPAAGWIAGSRTSMARMPMMHPRMRKTRSFLVSRFGHLLFRYRI